MSFEKIIEHGYDALRYISKMVSEEAVVADVAIGQTASYAAVSSLSSGQGVISLLCGAVGFMSIAGAYASFKLDKKMTRQLG
jgi:hypothetical protein